ncbi:MAG: hypothetical protein Q9202_002441 [Teloschistes flavicans]
MGNVIREVYTDESSGEVEPASKELEDAVTGWIAKFGTKPQTVDVWAVLDGPEKAEGVRSRVVEVVSRVLQGGRIQKVLSGGGGWGNKQGLLALDPEQDFNINPELSPVEGPGGEELSFEEVSSGFGHQPLRPRDTLMFCVQTPVPYESSTFGTSLEDKCRRSSITFGTTPSTIDAMSPSSSAIASDSTSQPCIIALGHFSMHSENGMTIGSTTEDGIPIQTKIDVPHSSISFEEGVIASNKIRAVKGFKPKAFKPVGEYQALPLVENQPEGQSLKEAIATGSRKKETAVDQTRSHKKGFRIRYHMYRF